MGSLKLKEQIKELKAEKKKQDLEFDSKIKGNNIIFYLDTKYQYKDINIYIEDDYLLTVKVGKAGTIRINKKNKIGKIIDNALRMGEKIRFIG